jgi:hypothetical protein
MEINRGPIGARGNSKAVTRQLLQIRQPLNSAPGGLSNSKFDFEAGKAIEWWPL